MDKEQMKKILGKQLELLSEKSEKCTEAQELAELSMAMEKIAQCLIFTV